MLIKNLTIRENRNFINGIPLAHFIWDHYNPVNKWKKGYFIHHKDEDTLNDHISNLKLVTPAEHNKIHSTGRVVSVETRNKLSKINKGKIISDWQKQQISEYMKNRKISFETRKKMSNTLKEKYKTKLNPFYGKHHSEESKQKISVANKGNKYCLGRISPFKGKHHSEETKIKMSKKIFTEEYKRKISLGCKEAWKRRKEEINK
jgi:hypothetical protein